MSGLKRVAYRRDDALTRVGWDRLETLLAAYYRSEGFQVEHVGTGMTGAKFDGGIDLKLRRGEQYVVVQCKHWNAMKVPHNAVHELLGLMVNEGASGAVLATSGEFTKAAIEAAARLGHVQLVDGNELRVMLGPLREPEPAVFDAIRMGGQEGSGATIAMRVGERLLSSAEGGVGRGLRDGAMPGASRGLVAKVTKALLGFVAITALVGAVYLLLTKYILVSPLSPPTTTTSPTSVAPAGTIEAPDRQATQAGATCAQQIDRPSGAYIDPCVKVAAPTPSERREQQRRAEAAIKTIADSTPEM